ncbi:hypothetical protein GCM10009814_11870 [Lapillicoccus jejuensis]
MRAADTRPDNVERGTFVPTCAAVPALVVALVVVLLGDGVEALVVDADGVPPAAAVEEPPEPHPARSAAAVRTAAAPAAGRA